MDCLAVNYHLVMKKPIYFNYLTILFHLYTELGALTQNWVFKEIKLVKNSLKMATTIHTPQWKLKQGLRERRVDIWLSVY